jgi:hypothetical protein
MSTLTGQYISQSYGGLIKLSTNTGIVAGVSTQLEDGVGTSLGIYYKTGGQISATGYTGSLSGTATSALSAISASYALNAQTAFSATSTSFATTSSFLIGQSRFATTGSNTFRGNQTISGSAFGAVTTLTIASQTASIDLSTGNFFRLSLPTGSNVYLNPTNIQIGQTSILEITQPLSGSVSTVSYPGVVTFPYGFAYTASAVLSTSDTINFISFDGFTLRAIAANRYQ